VLLALLPVLLFGFRRGVFAGLILVVLPQPAHAGLWDDLWLRPDQQAHQALQEGEADAAVGLFDNPEWEAIARYRAEDYAGAADGFARQTNVDGYYNLGNALAFNGEYEAALKAYDEALEVQPDHADAIHNRDIVAQLLEQQRSEQQDNQEEGQEGSNSDPSSEPQDGGEPQNSDQQNQQQGDQQQQPPQQQDQQQNEQAQSEPNEQQAESQEGDSNRDEKQDALEQWLRRVPDDPGGLLRRKFQYETNQRLRQGDYRSRETEQIW